MKYSVLALFMLVIAAAFIVGCTQSTPPAATPVPTAQPQATLTVEPKATFSLGQEYLHKKYSFNSAKDVFTEQFRVTNDPWAIDITVNPMSTDSQQTWFEITATNLDNAAYSQTFGYGRTNSYDKHQQFPMYHEGPYKFEMKGNLVSVDVIVAKRNA